MYNNDIKVTIEEAFEPSVGLINRALLVTHEATIPLARRAGKTNALKKIVGAFLVVLGALLAPITGGTSTLHYKPY